jgi:hypothetical protein
LSLRRVVCGSGAAGVGPVPESLDAALFDIDLAYGIGDVVSYI